MAKIVSFTKSDGNIGSTISEVECTYKVGNIDGEKYIALSTFGSSNRQKKSSASQIIHLDEKSALELVKLLKIEFSL